MPTFNPTVQVQDDGTGTLMDTATITIDLNDLNEAPVVNSQSFSVAVNSSNGTVVGTVVASDPDAGDTLTYSITAGNAAGAFAINASTGEVTVANSAALDFATTPSFDLTVEVQDTGGLTATTNLTYVNEAVAQVLDTSNPSTSEDSGDSPESDESDGSEAAATPEDPEPSTAEKTAQGQGPYGSEETTGGAWYPASPGRVEGIASEILDGAGPASERTIAPEAAGEGRSYGWRPGELGLVGGRSELVAAQRMSEALWQIRDEITQDSAEETHENDVVVSTAEGVALVVSTGVLAAVARGGSLLAACVSAQPLWCRVDPLPVLRLSNEERHKREDDLRAAEEQEDQGGEGLGNLLDG
jgi:hypothetical protein